MGYLNGTKRHNIFLLDNEKIKEKFLRSQTNTPSTTKLVENLLVEASRSQYKYKKQELKLNVDTYGYNIAFLFSKKNNNDNLLKSFCKMFIKEDADVCNFKTIVFSSIMLIWKNDNIFAIPTGQGFRVISPFIVLNFGMQIASMLNNDLLKVSAISSNTINSNIHRKSLVYSREIDFININELDSIYNEIIGRLYDKEEIKNLFELPDSKNKSSITILARDYIQFGAVADIFTLLHLIKQFDIPELKSQTDRFNILKPLIKSRDKVLITKNNNHLITDLYNIIKSNNELIYDIFNKNIEEYIHSDYFFIEFDNVNLIQCDKIDKKQIHEAYSKFLEKNKYQDSIDNFYIFINQARINSSKVEITDYVTTDSFLNHISGEITVDSDNYYILYGQYYKLEKPYIERLSENLNNKKLSLRFTQEIQTVWEKDFDEDKFNKKVAEEFNSGFIHMHKIIVNNIEFADLIKYDSQNKKIYIVHVKDGFNASMRALERQVTISIDLLSDLKNHDKDLKEIYNKASHSLLPHVNKINNIFKDFEDFSNKLLNCDIVYIIAIKTKNQNLINSRSNIAKYCLISLIDYCLNKNIDLKINFIKFDKV